MALLAGWMLILMFLIAVFMVCLGCYERRLMQNFYNNLYNNNMHRRGRLNPSNLHHHRHDEDSEENSVPLPVECSEETVSMSKEQALEGCPICLEALNEEGGQVAALMGCRHVFHHPCIVTWAAKSRLCPLCRQVIDRVIVLKIELELGQSSENISSSTTSTNTSTTTTCDAIV